MSFSRAVPSLRCLVPYAGRGCTHASLQNVMTHLSTLGAGASLVRRARINMRIHCRTSDWQRAPSVCSFSTRRQIFKHAIPAKPSTKQRAGAAVLHFFLWGVASVSFGVWAVGADQATNLLGIVPSSMALLQSEDPDLLERSLEELAQGTAQNHSLKREVAETAEHIDVILHLVENGSTNQICNNAIKVLENLSQLEELIPSLVAQDLHGKLVQLAARPGRSLFVQKSIAETLSNFVKRVELHGQLADAGVFQVLQQINSHKQLSRKRVDTAVHQLAYSIFEDAGCASHFRERFGPLEWNTLQKYAREQSLEMESVFYDTKNTLIESGALLYLHTALGGLVWGVFDSLRKAKPAKEVLRNGIRTSVVTSLVPIYLVGAVVSAFNYLQKRMDSPEEKFALYSGGAMSLYPLSRILPIIEVWAPNWLGGHIVGFTSFFLYLLYTNNDLLKSDSQLINRDLMKSKMEKTSTQALDAS